MKNVPSFLFAVAMALKFIHAQGPGYTQHVQNIEMGVIFQQEQEAAQKSAAAAPVTRGGPRYATKGKWHDCPGPDAIPRYRAEWEAAHAENKAEKAVRKRDKTAATASTDAVKLREGSVTRATRPSATSGSTTPSTTRSRIKPLVAHNISVL